MNVLNACYFLEGFYSSTRVVQSIGFKSKSGLFFVSYANVIDVMFMFDDDVS